MPVDIQFRQIPKIKHAAIEYGYLCWIFPDGKPNTLNKTTGTHVKPLSVDQGGTGGPAFDIATEAELIAFAMQPDVILYFIVCRSAADIGQELQPT